MAKLLGKKPSNNKNRQLAVAARDVTATWVKTNKVNVKHPHLSGYSEVALRVRFLKGFEEEALSILQGIAHKLGRRGLAHKPYPISKAVLMPPENLTANAFTTAREKEAVPPYRDGHNGQRLQLAMARAVHQRCFEHRADPNQEAFGSARMWVAYARLAPVVEEVLEVKFGADPRVWPDRVAAFATQLHVGEHDAEVLKVSAQIPGHFDSRVGELKKLVKDIFPPLTRMLHSVEAAKKMGVSEQPPQPQQTDPAPEGEAPVGSQGSTGEPRVGDVTDQLAKELDSAPNKRSWSN